LDVGVPWPEALEGTDSYHPNVLKIISGHVSEYRSGQVRYVSTTPQAQDRVTLAPYWAEDDNLDLPSKWKDKSFDDPEVVKAYLNWCRFLLKTYRPKYFNYGIEVNYGFSGTNDERYIAYKKLLEAVYPKLKLEFPSVKILLEIVNTSFETNKENVIEMGRELIRYSDIIGISTYPYVVYSNLDDIPENWLSELADLDRRKPIAITETGYIAETLNLSKLELISPGSPEIQMRYTQKLLSALNDFDTEFVIWWEVRDTDQTLNDYANAGVDLAAVSIWKDIGFYDSMGKARPALKVWDLWLKLPKD
jgi:arabinogalactan endo-1,4-beta-galactosidase